MDWNAISGVADTISALGVIGSLIYVGIQIKKNTVESRRANARQTSHDHALAIHAIMDTVIAEIVQRGMADLDTLDNVERYQFDLAIMVWLQAIEQAFADYIEHDYPEDMVKTYRTMVPGVLNCPGGLRWWNERKVWYSDDFQKQVDNLLTTPPKGSEAAGIRPTSVPSST